MVAAYAALQLGEMLVFAMEYVEGEDLAQVVKTRGPLPVVNACYYVQQAALGLQHACDKQMVHRDIKPQNLILARVGKKHVVKILDFGLAKVVREKAEESALTGAGKMLGTPDYIAPEQAMDAARADIRADIYSLGCTFYYLLTGGPPFKGNSLFAILQAHATEAAPPVGNVRAEVPPAVTAVVAKMMAKDLASRYQKPAEVAQALTPMVKSAGKAVTSEPGVKAVPVGRIVEKPQKSAETIVPIAYKKETMAEHPGAVVKIRLPATRRTAASGTGQRKWILRISATFAMDCLIFLAGLWAAGVFRAHSEDDVLHAEGGGRKDVTAPKNEIATAERHGKRPSTENSAPEDKGFVPLFNGKDLTGWKTHPSQPGHWRVKNGILIGSGPGTSHLYSERADYKNFHVRAETRINAGGNSGVYGRASFGPLVSGRWPFGYEAQINCTHGDPNKTGSLFANGHGPLVSLRHSPVPPGEWFTLDLIAEENHIVVQVNGVTTADVRDDPRWSSGGCIALQQHNPQTVCEFRKIEIKELPPIGDSGKVLNSAKEIGTGNGFVQLFNGQDLTGWKTHPKQSSGWTVENGLLTGRARQGNTHLFTERGAFGDFHLRAEVKCTDTGNSGIYFRSPFDLPKGGTAPGGYEAQILNRYDKPGPLTGSLHGLFNSEVEPPPADQWFTLEIIALANDITIKVDDRTTAHYVDASGRPMRGHIALQAWNPATTVVHFRKIEIKELQP